MRLLFITYGRVRLNMHGVYHAARFLKEDLTCKSKPAIGYAIQI